MSSKIFKAVNSYKLIENMNIGWCDMLEKNLSKETKLMVEESSISLHPLAVIIKMTVNKASTDNDIEPVFKELWGDKDLIRTLTLKYKND